MKGLIIYIAKLKKAKILSPQQYKTIRGQIYSGDISGAEKGIDTIIKKKVKNWNDYKSNLIDKEKVEVE